MENSNAFKLNEMHDNWVKPIGKTTASCSEGEFYKKRINEMIDNLINSHFSDSEVNEFISEIRFHELPDDAVKEGLGSILDNIELQIKSTNFFAAIHVVTFTLLEYNIDSLVIDIIELLIRFKFLSTLNVMQEILASLHHMFDCYEITHITDIVVAHSFEQIEIVPYFKAFINVVINSYKNSGKVTSNAIGYCIINSLDRFLPDDSCDYVIDTIIGVYKFIQTKHVFLLWLQKRSIYSRILTMCANSNSCLELLYYLIVRMTSFEVVLKNTSEFIDKTRIRISGMVKESINAFDFLSSEYPRSTFILQPLLLADYYEEMTTNEKKYHIRMMCKAIIKCKTIEDEYKCIRSKEFYEFISHIYKKTDDLDCKRAIIFMLLKCQDQNIYDVSCNTKIRIQCLRYMNNSDDIIELLLLSNHLIVDLNNKKLEMLNTEEI